MARLCWPTSDLNSRWRELDLQYGLPFALEKQFIETCYYVHMPLSSPGTRPILVQADSFSHTDWDRNCSFYTSQALQYEGHHLRPFWFGTMEIPFGVCKERCLRRFGRLLRPYPLSRGTQWEGDSASKPRMHSSYSSRGPGKDASNNNIATLKTRQQERQDAKFGGPVNCFVNSSPPTNTCA